MARFWAKHYTQMMPLTPRNAPGREVLSWPTSCGWEAESLERVEHGELSHLTNQIPSTHWPVSGGSSPAHNLQTSLTVSLQEPVTWTTIKNFFSEPMSPKPQTMNAQRRRNNLRWHEYEHFFNFMPGKSHGRKSLVGCSPWGRSESGTTERLHFHI